MADESIERVPVIGGVSDFLTGDVPWATAESPVYRTPKQEIKIQELPKGLPSTEQLATMSEEELIGLRTTYAKRHDVQNYLAPFEHRANMRQRVGENILSALVWPILVPAYTAAKTVGAIPSDVETSTAFGEEIKQGIIGIGEGIMQHFQEKPKEKK